MGRYKLEKKLWYIRYKEKVIIFNSDFKLPLVFFFFVESCCYSFFCLLTNQYFGKSMAPTFSSSYSKSLEKTHFFSQTNLNAALKCKQFGSKQSLVLEEEESKKTCVMFHWM